MMDNTLPVVLTVALFLFMSNFKIEIIDYEKKSQTVFYTIEIMANNTKKWVIDRKFRDIEEMHKRLTKKLPNMPYLPAKSIFRLGEDDLDKRKDDLEKYLNVLASRKDTLSDPEFKVFLDLERHVKSEHLTVVKDLYEISNLPMSAKDFVYSPAKGILFALLTETRVVSKIGSLLSSISKMQDISYVYCYQEEPPGSFDFTRLWQHGSTLEATFLCWSEALTLLAIGYANGLVECLRVSTETGYNKFTPFCKVHCHTQIISGLLMLSESGHMISCAHDKYLVKTDIANNEAHIAEKEHPYPLTAMILDKQNKRFFLADSIGTIYIYSPNEKFNLLASIPFHKENFVKSLFFDKHRSLLIAGSNQGMIVVYEIGKPGREKFSVYTTSFGTVKQIRGLHFDGKSKELYVSNSAGTVAFVNSLTTIPFHMLDAHQGEVNKMTYIENQKMLITAGDDRSIRFWRYPFDPEEKLPARKSHAPKLAATYSYSSSSEPVNKSIQKKAEVDEQDGSDDDNSPRAPITLFQYRPAKEPVLEPSDEEEEETSKVSNQKAKTAPKNEPAKEEEPEETSEQEEEPKKITKVKKRPEHPLAFQSDDSEEEDPKKKEAATASPKSFLFKNSVTQVIKKEDIRNLGKKTKKGEDQETEEQKAQKAKEEEEKVNNPLLRTEKPSKKASSENIFADKKDKNKEADKSKEIKSEQEKPKKTEEANKKKEDSNELPSQKEEKEPNVVEKPAKEIVNKQEEAKESKNVKTEDKQPEKPIAKKPAENKDSDDPLLGPGIKSNKPKVVKPVVGQKKNFLEANENEPDPIVPAVKDEAQTKRKKIIKKLMDDESGDDDNLLDFQGFKNETKYKASKPQRNDSDDEGLAGWAK